MNISAQRGTALIQMIKGGKAMPLVQTNKDNDFPLYLFHQGKNYEAGKFFGAHRIKNSDCWRFRVWAPRAKSVSVIGDFNNWERKENPIEKIS